MYLCQHSWCIWKSIPLKRFDENIAVYGISGILPSTISQFELCTCFLNLSCAHVLSVWVAHMFSQFELYTCSLSLNCAYVLSVWVVHMFSQFELFICSLSLSCTHVLSVRVLSLSYTHVLSVWVLSVWVLHAHVCCMSQFLVVCIVLSLNNHLFLVALRQLHN